MLRGHRLERLGSLAFDLEYGACSVMNNQSIYLCFKGGGATSFQLFTGKLGRAEILTACSSRPN